LQCRQHHLLSRNQRAVRIDVASHVESSTFGSSGLYPMIRCTRRQIKEPRVSLSVACASFSRSLTAVKIVGLNHFFWFAERPSADGILHKIDSAHPFGSLGNDPHGSTLLVRTPLLEIPLQAGLAASALPTRPR
jgi:hypothetical protein